jgi:hypothetical protein
MWALQGWTKGPLHLRAAAGRAAEGPGSTVQLALAVLQAVLVEHQSCCDVRPCKTHAVLGMFGLRGTC